MIGRRPGLTVLAAAVIAAPAGAARSGGPSVQAEALARCIARHVPRGGQFYAASDGSFRVVSFGPRGKAAEWTVREGGSGPVISRQGGSAGLDRALKGTCF